jgi:hypothetical protein
VTFNLKRLGQRLLFGGLMLLLAPVFAGMTLLLMLAAPFLWLRNASLCLRWHRTYGRQGTRYLAIYTDSPKWKLHFENEVLAPLGTKARAINLSKTPTFKRSHSLEAAVHRTFGGHHEHTPIVFEFRGLRVREHRFYAAYLDQLKHHDSKLLAEETLSLLRPKA